MGYAIICLPCNCVKKICILVVLSHTYPFVYSLDNILFDMSYLVVCRKCVLQFYHTSILGTCHFNQSYRVSCNIEYVTSNCIVCRKCALQFYYLIIHLSLVCTVSTYHSNQLFITSYWGHMHVTLCRKCAIQFFYHTPILDLWSACQHHMTYYIWLYAGNAHFSSVQSTIIHLSLHGVFMQ